MNRIIVFFNIGAGKLRCRLVLAAPDTLLPDRLEKFSVDALGAPAWVPLDGSRGMPDNHTLVRRVLHLVFDRAPAIDGLRLWPDGVTRTEHGFEVELGEVR